MIKFGSKLTHSVINHIKCSHHLIFISNTMIILLVLVAPACSDLDSSSERILIENNPSVLSTRIQYSQDIITIDTTNNRNRVGRTIQAGADTVILTLVAEVSPPEHNGIVLQATDVRMKDDKAYVSYNVQGETFLGAVDIYDVTDINQPTLLSSAIFTDTDINGIRKKADFYILQVQQTA